MDQTIVNHIYANLNFQNDSLGMFSWRDTSICFLWKEDKYDSYYGETFNTIIINEEYCKKISDPERAALGYVATFIGSECWWDGDNEINRSNLKCKILSSLDLGYQCSDTHLTFLQNWFKNDAKVLSELEDCPTIPYTSTVQETFDKIDVIIKGNVILISFKASGINLREGLTWTWTEIDYFLYNHDNIVLKKKKRSKISYEQIYDLE